MTSGLPKWQILDKVTIKLHSKSEILTENFVTVNTASIPGTLACFPGIIPETILADGSETAHLWGQYKEPLGSSSQVWSWSSHWHGPTVLSTLQWSLGEINLPAMQQLHVKLACGIAYGMTIGWLVSQTWEDAKKICRRDTSLIEEAAAQHALSPCETDTA